MRGNRHASSKPAQLARTLPEFGMGIDHAALTDAGMGNIRIFLNTVPCFNGMDESLTFRSLITVTVSPLLRTLPLTSFDPAGSVKGGEYISRHLLPRDTPAVSPPSLAADPGLGVGPAHVAAAAAGGVTCATSVARQRLHGGFHR